MSVKIIAEIGINHNGDLNIAKKLIDIASVAGCDFVKFQKRNPDICVPSNEKNKTKTTPWGNMSYLDYKWKIEFDRSDYDEIDDYCAKKKINWFASVWDDDSVDFMRKYTDTVKIPSALLTHHSLGEYAREKNNFLMLSTGMSNESDIDAAIAAPGVFYASYTQTA